MFSICEICFIINLLLCKYRRKVRARWASYSIPWEMYVHIVSSKGILPKRFGVRVFYSLVKSKTYLEVEWGCVQHELEVLLWKTRIPLDLPLCNEVSPMSSLVRYHLHALTSLKPLGHQDPPSWCVNFKLPKPLSNSHKDLDTHISSHNQAMKQRRWCPTKLDEAMPALRWI